MILFLGFVGVAFTMGSLSMWFPQFLALAYVNRGDIPPCTTTDCEYSSVMMKFGIFTAVAGIVGVGIGLSGSATWKKERDGKPGNQRKVSEIFFREKIKKKLFFREIIGRRIRIFGESTLSILKL